MNTLLLSPNSPDVSPNPTLGSPLPGESSDPLSAALRTSAKAFGKMRGCEDAGVAMGKMRDTSTGLRVGRWVSSVNKVRVSGR